MKEPIKSKLTKLEAFQCTACGKAFEVDPPLWTTIANHSVHSPERRKYRNMQKAAAEACCTCPQCKQKCDRYMGTSNKLCSKCKSSNEWTYVTTELTKALDAYERVAWPIRGENRREPELEAALRRHADADETMQAQRRKADTVLAGLVHAPRKRRTR